MMGDLRYVHPSDVHAFGSPAKRARMWSRDGNLGKYLRNLDVMTVVHGNMFMHGGLHPTFADRDVNGEVRKLLNQGLCVWAESVRSYTA
jgi:hypothetical protein